MLEIISYPYDAVFSSYTDYWFVRVKLQKLVLVLFRLPVCDSMSKGSNTCLGDLKAIRVNIIDLVTKKIVKMTRQSYIKSLLQH